MGASYSKLDTAPLTGSIISRLMSTVYSAGNNIKGKVNNITINIIQESCHQDRCVNKIQKMNKLVPIIEFL